PPRAFRHYGCRSSRRAQSSGCPSSRGFREVGIFRSLTSDTVRFLTTHRSKRGQPEISRGSIRHRSGRFRRRALVSQRLNATLRRTGTVFDAPGPGFTSAHGPCFANARFIDTGFTSAHSPSFANTCYIDTGFSSAHSPCFANTRYIDTGFSSAHSPCFANTRFIDTGFSSARLANNRRPCFANTTRFANTCFTNDRFTDAWFVNVNDHGFLNVPSPRFTNDCGFSSAPSSCFTNDCGFSSAPSPCFANDHGFLNVPSPRFTNDCGFSSAPSPRFANDRGFPNVPSPRFTNDRGFSSAHARRQPISRADSSRCNDLRARPISNCPISIGPGGLIPARAATYESGAIIRPQ